ncbi:glycosyl hydrolase family 39 [Acidobacterium sp. S8]|uniref:glycosyl hydrolase family 39 n=1 Tax=Acidobacterium sp. S8 TaxID=1641854 RepID=UPI001C20333A|nr:glycosyl hydrolase family 39 [Acidobacterium sp. S8]
MRIGLVTKHLLQHHWIADRFVWLFVTGFACIATPIVMQGQQPLQLTIQWDKTTVVSKSTPTLQVVVNPPLRPGQPLSAASYKAVKELGADDVRYVPWFPYPKLAVAELEPPTATKTNWDFSLIDPMTKDFLEATAGHPTVMNFSTSPAWLYKTDKPITYPEDPNTVDWRYTQGTELRDPTDKELSDYYARLVSWYTKGGFTDELGVRHQSGYHYSFPIWEVLNEVEAEHSMTPEAYTKRYDAIVAGIRRVSPGTKFMGMALAAPRDHPEFFEYFLNPANHTPGTPLDYISYHFYASPSPSQTISDWQYTFFDQADGFLSTVRYIDNIRKRLSPRTKTDLDELGVILPTDNTAADKEPPPAAYYNLAGSLYAYLYVALSQLQIDIIGESQLVGYPSQYPSVSMMNWINNQPNPRFWVLKLIKDNFHPGDSLVDTNLGGTGAGDVEAQAFVTTAGRKLLLANKRNHAVDVKLPDAQKANAVTVDESTGDEPARSVKVIDGKIRLEPFAVSVISW